MRPQLTLRRQLKPNPAPRFEGNGAEFSPCGQYRHLLWRRFGEGKLLPFMMLNPSSAGAEENDATVSKCIAFAKYHEYAGIIVVNQFGIISTDPAELYKVKDPYGAGNKEAIRAVAEYCKETGAPIVCAWGSHVRNFNVPYTPAWWRFNGAMPVALKVLHDGVPGHPLYLKGDSPLIPLPLA